MLKNLLNVDGLKSISKNEQKNVIGGFGFIDFPKPAVCLEHIPGGVPHLQGAGCPIGQACINGQCVNP